MSTARVSGPSTAAMTLTRAALDGHVQQDVLGVVTTEYAVDVSATTPGYGDYLGSTVRVSGTPVYESAYEHDALGRITEWTETVEGSTRVQRFEYDDAGRLVGVRDELDVPVADYEYDLNGNRLNVVEPGRVLELGVNLGCPDGSTPLARAATDRDELCRHGDYDYTYDANGRLQTRVNVTDPLDETVYTYDGGGRLQMVAYGSHTIEYLHDAFGRRVGRVVNGVFERGWLYKDSLKPIAQVNAAGDVEATYVYVTRANVPDYIVTTAGAVYRVVADHLGSVRMLVNATTGAVVERYDYDVWGRVTHESGDHSLHPFGYAGGLYDADTGLVRFGVRDYDADAGRWTAPEPLGFAAEANWYRYANGDPVNFMDVTGRAWEPWKWGWQDLWLTDSNDSNGGSLVGKIMFNSPNTLIGLVMGGFCQSEDTNWSIGNNAIEVRSVPWLGTELIPTPALTIGNVILYSEASPSQHTQDHERQHTFQGETLGPLYLPVHIISQLASAAISAASGETGPPGPFHRHNYFEDGPMSTPPMPW